MFGERSIMGNGRLVLTNALSNARKYQLEANKRAAEDCMNEAEAMNVEFRLHQGFNHHNDNKSKVKWRGKSRFVSVVKAGGKMIKKAVSKLFTKTNLENKVEVLDPVTQKKKLVDLQDFWASPSDLNDITLHDDAIVSENSDEHIYENLKTDDEPTYENAIRLKTFFDK